MGANTFTTLASGADAEQAFQAAVRSAQYDYGHAGYTGTIAEKGDFVKVTSSVLTEDQAEALAYKLINDNDSRVDDKWGPAGAIPVKTRTRDVQVKGLSGFLGDNDGIKAAALEALRKQRKIRRGEKVERVWLSSYQTPPARYGYGLRGGPTSFSQGTATVTLAKSKAAFDRQDTPDAWLFFGWASS